MEIHKLFELDDFNFRCLQLRTKAQSLKYGRLLYEYQDGIDHYWVKTQLPNHPSHEQSFQNELNFYQHVHDALKPILLDYEIFKLKPLHSDVLFGYKSLILPHMPLLFDSISHDLSLDQITHKMLMALSAVETLHLSGWIHGDLKSEHFGQMNKQVKLIDFEQSFNFQDLNQPILNATPHYMAPELFHGEAKSPASDVYALGVIFLEWLTQHRFQITNYQEWAILHCQQLEIVLPRQYQCFEPLLNMMLMKNKMHRVMDFSALKTRLLIDVV